MYRIINNICRKPFGSSQHHRLLFVTDGRVFLDRSIIATDLGLILLGTVAMGDIVIILDLPRLVIIGTGGCDLAVGLRAAD